MIEANEYGGGHEHGSANKHWDCDVTAQVPAKASYNRSDRHGKSQSQFNFMPRNPFATEMPEKLRRRSFVSL